MHADDSNKVPWLRPLVNATRRAMVRLRSEGRFRRTLFVDTWHMSSLPGAPFSPDGNHRATSFQTLVWALVRHAWEGFRRIDRQTKTTVDR